MHGGSAGGAAHRTRSCPWPTASSNGTEGAGGAVGQQRDLRAVGEARRERLEDHIGKELGVDAQEATLVPQRAAGVQLRLLHPPRPQDAANARLLDQSAQLINQEVHFWQPLDICDRILKLLRDHLEETSSSGESKVFYKKMKGDYYRYLAEFQSSAGRQDAAKCSRSPCVATCRACV